MLAFLTHSGVSVSDLALAISLTNFDWSPFQKQASGLCSMSFPTALTTPSSLVNRAQLMKKNH